MQSKNNNCFDYINIICSFVVMFTHYCVWGLGIPFPIDCFFSAGNAVCMLFSICGYLAMGSLERNDNKWEYLKRRFCRVYLPVYCVVFISEPMLAWAGYDDWSKFSIAKVVKALVMGCGIGGANGALWTIFIQASFFFFLALFYKTLKEISMTMWLICIIIGVGLSCAWNEIFFRGRLLKFIANHLFLPYLYLFLIGCFCYKYQKYIKKNVFFAIIILFLYLGLNYLIFNMKIEFPGVYVNVISGTLSAIVAIIVGIGIPAGRIKSDFSFQIYCWHMPILNFILALINNNKYLVFVLSVCFTIIISKVTWKYIEVPCMNLYKRK